MQESGIRNILLQCFFFLCHSGQIIQYLRETISEIICYLEWNIAIIYSISIPGWARNPAEVLTQGLEVVRAWVGQNKLKLNPCKSVLLYVCDRSGLIQVLSLAPEGVIFP